MPTISPTHKRAADLVRGGMLAVAAAIGLAGCSSDNDATWSQIVDATRAAWNSDNNITLQQAAAVPYASMGFRVGDSGPQRMIVLASQAQQNQLWTSAAHIAFVTDNGRIISSAGLGTDLSASTFDTNGDALASFENGDRRTRQTIRFVDFPNLNKYSVALRCTISDGGSENVVILGKAIRTRRVNEHCQSEVLDWSFDNVFWLADAPGLIWRSIQNLHPDLAPVETEILRPPSSTAQ